jgi:hypothetical protein
MGRGAGVLVAGLLVATLAACGGEDEPETAPSPSESTSESSPSPSPTKTEEPLSEFEDEPQVKAVREFLELSALAVNRGDEQMSNARGVMTARGADVLPSTIARDVGLYYPGPVPFTPTSVRVDAKEATVPGCVLADGFAKKNEKAGKPARKRQVIAVNFGLVKVDGTWKVDSAKPGALACKGVEVEAVTW